MINIKETGVVPLASFYKGGIKMAESNQDNQAGRNGLKNQGDVLHQPDADRSEWQTHTLSYDETMAFLKGSDPAKPEYHLDDQVLAKIRAEVKEINDEDTNSVIEDKYQQILMARYNADQDANVTVGFGKNNQESTQEDK